MDEVFQNTLTGAFAPDAFYGIGCGQGSWHNRHFSDLESATVAFEAEVSRTRQAFESHMPTLVTEEPIAADNPTLIRRAVISNRLKSGKPGKYRYIVHLYRIEEATRRASARLH